MSPGSDAENSSFSGHRMAENLKYVELERLPVDKAVVRAVEKIPGSGCLMVSYHGPDLRVLPKSLKREAG